MLIDNIHVDKKVVFTGLSLLFGGLATLASDKADDVVIAKLIDEKVKEALANQK